MNRGRGLASRSKARRGDGYADWVKAQLAADPRCHVGPLIRLEDPTWSGCTGRADGMHHLRKQGSGSVRISEANTLRCCNPCNGYVEDHPPVADAAGLVLRSGHDEFGQLGRRAARETL